MRKAGINLRGVVLDSMLAAALVDATRSSYGIDSLALAQQLYGIPMRFKGPDFASAVAMFVAEYGITHIVMGCPRRPWYRRWLGSRSRESDACRPDEPATFGRNNAYGRWELQRRRLDL